jgi:hypothetical protein
MASAWHQQRQRKSKAAWRSDNQRCRTSLFLPHTSFCTEPHAPHTASHAVFARTFLCCSVTSRRRERQTRIRPQSALRFACAGATALRHGFPPLQAGWAATRRVLGVCTRAWPRHRGVRVFCVAVYHIADAVKLAPGRLRRTPRTHHASRVIRHACASNLRKRASTTRRAYETLRGKRIAAHNRQVRR